MSILSRFAARPKTLRRVAAKQHPSAKSNASSSMIDLATERTTAFKQLTKAHDQIDRHDEDHQLVEDHFRSLTAADRAIVEAMAMRNPRPVPSIEEWVHGISPIWTVREGNNLFVAVANPEAEPPDTTQEMIDRGRLAVVDLNAT